MTRTTNAAAKGRRSPPPAPTTAPAMVPSGSATLQLVDPAPIVAAIDRLGAGLAAMRLEVAAIAVAVQRPAPVAPAAEPSVPVAFISAQDAATMIGVTPRVLKVMVDELRFPRPVRVGGNPTRDRRFVRTEVVEWIEARVSERALTPQRPTPTTGMSAAK